MGGHIINPKSLETLIILSSLKSFNNELPYIELVKLDILGSCLDLVDLGFVKRRTEKNKYEVASFYSITDKGKRYIGTVIDSARKILDQGIYK